MIKHLVVRNFKSIKSLKLDCKKVNIFVGKPNTGKSNILESVGLFTLQDGIAIQEVIRLENMANLFYDQDLTEKIEIIVADDFRCQITFKDGIFEVSAKKGTNTIFSCHGSYDPRNLQRYHSGIPAFKFYRFKVLNTFAAKESTYLLPPKGENLLAIFLTNKLLKKTVADIFGESGFKIVLKPHEDKIELQKEIEDVVISYPYSLVSDTLQRLVFHLVAIETNEDSIIIFEEPEAHAFPYYTKFLAERISLDKTNQYFISTHNPYFLLSLLEKTPKNHIGIFITYLKDYQTRVRPILEKEMAEILDLDIDVFFNLDRFLEEE